ncbi:MAG TPA: hypothetical protein VFW68_02360 [Rhodocyclaceae bacterium]|nr:hypothetical protein [Rhodocyclaceae bacterium]
MQPIHDIDVVILMAVTLAAKRRPAELVDIVAAADLIQGMIPFESKLGSAIASLTFHGLIQVEGEGFTLTPAGLALVADPPKKADTPALIAALREKMASYYPRREHAAVELPEEQLAAAVSAHKKVKKTPAKNMVMPKPVVDRHFKVEGRWRRVTVTRKRTP